MSYTTERRAGPLVIAAAQPPNRACELRPVSHVAFSVGKQPLFSHELKAVCVGGLVVVANWKKWGWGCSRGCGARDWAHAAGPARGWTAPAARGIQGSDRAQTPEYTASVSGRSRAREPALVGRAQVAGPVPFHAPAGHWAVAPPLRVRGQFGHSTGNAVRTPASAETRTSPAFSPGLFPYS